MHNELFSIGPITIYGYGLMIAIGVIAAYLLAEQLAKKSGLQSDRMFNILIISVISGFLGAKLLYYITILKDIIANPKILLDVADGFVVYGGIIAGVAAVIVYCKMKKLPFWKFFDCVAPAIALAQGLGRVGCFLSGCCYGVEMDSPISITFTESICAPNNVPLFPSQIVSSVFNLLHCGVLLLLFKKNKQPGKIGAFYLVFYSIGRFVIEFFRGDLERGSVGVLSTSQFISLFVLAAGIALVVLISKKKIGQQEEEETGVKAETEEN